MKRIITVQGVINDVEQTSAEWVDEDQEQLPSTDEVLERFAQQHNASDTTCWLNRVTVEFDWDFSQ